MPPASQRGCASAKELESFAASHPGISLALKRHLATAAESFERPLPLFRTLDEWKKRDPVPKYSEMSALRCNALNVVNCHNGQRKLIMALLEFVVGTLKETKSAPEDLVVVYIGASGLASVVASTLFPDVQFILFDPAPNTAALIDPSFKDITIVRNIDLNKQKVRLNKRVTLFTDAAGMFSDSTIAPLRALLAKSSPKRLLAIASDIRMSSENNEGGIVHDMLQQQRWTRELEARAYMFKFRIPYSDVESMIDRYHSAWPGVRRRRGSFPYLAGKLHIQLYPQHSSAELRLIGHTFQRHAMYSMGGIEDAMSLYNLVYRGNAVFAVSKANGHGQTYEEASETLILSRIAAASRLPLDHVRHVVDALIHRFVNKDWAQCVSLTSAVPGRQCARSQAAMARLKKCTKVVS